MHTSDFDYPLPPERIAQTPAPERDGSRLLVLERASGRLTHRRFPDLLDYLQPGDVLVLNNSRVIPARLRGVKAGSGGKVEVLLVEENQANNWWVMLRPGRRVRVGTQIIFLNTQGRPTEITATVTEKNSEAHCRLLFAGTTDLRATLDALGETPLPLYIRRTAEVGVFDRERYQTVYAQSAGSIAAPTAGLHFTDALLEKIRALGAEVCLVTLHVGLGTFGPVKTEELEKHVMHEERFELSHQTADAINQAKRDGRRVVAVGTTTVRVLESVAAHNEGRLMPTAGRTRIFIYPPFDFKIADALLTNFHLPKSTLLLLVSAFATPGEASGRDLILSAYAGAIRERYRFYSYGDAMLIL